jgi:hypothetical protein
MHPVGQVRRHPSTNAQGHAPAGVARAGTLVTAKHQCHRCGGAIDPEDSPLPKINYAFEKRQRELAKKKLQDAKQSKKRPVREGEKPAERPNGASPH